MGLCPNCKNEMTVGEYHFLDVDKEYCEMYREREFLGRVTVQMEEEKKVEPAFYCVAIVLHDQSYGGPEEEGWWYSTYEPAREYAHMTVVRKTEEEILKVQGFLDQFIKEAGLNQFLRSVNSMASAGQYTTMVYADEYPCSLPKERPHYE